jgi:hypothetical protein
MCKDLC